MKASCRKRSRLGLAVAGLALLPMLALAQQPDTERAAPPLPERLGNAPGDGAVVGDPHHQRAFSCQIESHG